MSIRLLKDRYFITSVLIFEITIVRLLALLSDFFLKKAVYGQYLGFGVCLALLCAFYILNIKKKIVLKCLSTTLAFSFFYILSFLFFSEGRSYFTEYRVDILQVVLFGSPMFLLVSSVEKPIEFLKEIKNISRFLLFILLIAYFLNLRTSYLSTMGWGMISTPVSIAYLTSLFFNKSKNKDFFSLVLSFVFPLLGGRQWLVILVVFLIGATIFRNESLARKTVTIGATSIAAIFFILVFTQYGNYFHDFLDGIGIKSRALDMLFSDQLLDTSNRNSIYKFSIEIINKNGIKINGFFADRYFLRQYRSTIAYAHNIFLELLIDFGLGLGGVISLFLIFKIVSVFLKCKREYKLFYIFFVCVGFLRFLISSSIFSEPLFWAFCGCLFNCEIVTKERKLYARNKVNS